jgi:hypothetical protein
VSGDALARGVHGAVEGAVEAARARRAVRHIHQTCRRGVRAGRALNRSVASHRAVVAGRAHVVNRGVETLHAGLADVADLESGLTALMRGSDRAATAAEVALAALGGGFSEASGTAVVTGRALRAFRDVL